MAVLFKINTTDLTQWVDRENFNCNKTDVFQDWTDGNWVSHRDVVRTQITGSLNLRFPKEADFTAFKTLLSTARNANGYYPITIWCSTTQAEETINAFLDISAVTRWDVTCPRVWRGVTVAVTER